MNRLVVPRAAVSAAVFTFVLTLSFSVGYRSLRAAETPKGHGSALFESKCVMCHGTDGSGNTPIGKAMKVLDLRSHEVQKQSNAQLAAIISHGKEKMPAFGNSLTKTQINELVAFIHGLAKKK